MKGPVTQDWTFGLTYMQQSVLLTAIRGPDGLHKNHVSKKLCRWLRRCILRVAFTGEVINNPYDERGGSFTGPSISAGNGKQWHGPMIEVLDEYLKRTDETPHHFQLHLIHASEILAYKHPNNSIRRWWMFAYLALVNDMHLIAEDEGSMDKRLGDNEEDWRSTEEVTVD